MPAAVRSLEAWDNAAAPTGVLGLIAADSGPPAGAGIGPVRPREVGKW